MNALCTHGQAALAKRIGRKCAEILAELDRRYPSVVPDLTFSAMLTEEHYTHWDLPRVVIALRKFLVGKVASDALQQGRLEEAMRALGEAILLRWHPALLHVRRATA